MEADSEGENQNKISSSSKNANNSNEGQSKPRRQMKTPFQLETLETAYALETYPSEATRAELSEKLGLSDRQLQMWFCHRRLKDKKETPAKKPRKGTVTAAVAAPESPIDELRTGVEPGSDYVSRSGSGSGSSPYMDSRKLGSRLVVDDLPPARRYYESPRSIMELRAIACVEAQLGEPLREDGPILGMEFDPLPPDAFGAPIAAMVEQQKRSVHTYDSKIYERRDVKSSKVAPRGLHEYQFLQDRSSNRSDAYGQIPASHFHDFPADSSRARNSPFVHENKRFSRFNGIEGTCHVRVLSQQDKLGHVSPIPHGSDEVLPCTEPITNNGVNAQLSVHPTLGTENLCVLSNGQTFNDDVSLESKRKSEDARSGREVEALENRMRKEQERQEIRRRKDEERMRKEMEKHEREKRREEERLMRERQREEERSQREQRREMERREKFLQKEQLRAEKKRQKEELRREKEAARRKVAIEKAAARKIARESMDLIEDEQLELMELAAASKGLPSIINLDHDAMQNLDSFRDVLTGDDGVEGPHGFNVTEFLDVFPPRTVQLKRPFATQPWIDSEENIGNLLMVWRFLITFADVLGLWPFTLDEFVQAFHDYDSRLLGEIHVALLKLIIKDIEDVARTPSSGIGTSQYCAANPEGGHLQIVEGAYSWGFNICSWQRHLSPLTWPEILRQFALSAGFGPQLKKRSVMWPYMCDHDELPGRGGDDVVSTLRNGSAAENAFTLMRERGLLLPRRSRHRLTPGTVKFAAFHVLSLEGSKGLTVLELADKIQKSGLRDLTTSKTPEASISVALTRDTKLFERIAPSTYCVRAAFRKDPADAEAILAEARKKIRIFENGFLGTEDAEDIERDEDSECDDEDPEVDDLTIPSVSNKNLNQLNGSGSENADLCHVTSDVHSELNKDFLSISLKGSKDVACTGSAKQYTAGTDIWSTNIVQVKDESDASKSGELWAQGAQIKINNISDDLRLNSKIEVCEDFSSSPLKSSQDVVLPSGIKQSAGNEDVGASKTGQIDFEIDDSKSGESWIQGLAEGEYSHLSVEERLGALVALTGVANEGNTIRAVLEGRLEAANALKKQMWAEAQLDKGRLKEENVTKIEFPSFLGSKAETELPRYAVEGSQSPLPETIYKTIGASPTIAEDQKSGLGSQAAQNHADRTIVDLSVGVDNASTQQHGYFSKRSRSQMKSYIAQIAEEMYVYRSLPLGQDRRRNRYWQFVASASRNDPCSCRIFVELQAGNWRLIDSEEAFDSLLASLDARGIRESHLRMMLQKVETSFKECIRRNVYSAGQSQNSIKNNAAEMDSSPDGAASSDSPGSVICSDVSDSFFRIELGKNEAEKKSSLKRYQDYQRWIWKECINSLTLCAFKCGRQRETQLLATCAMCLDSYLFEDTHCLSCHQTFRVVDSNFNFSEHAIQCEVKRKSNPRGVHILDSSLPLGIRLLKALFALIEVSIPEEALESYWREVQRKTWAMKLHTSSSTEELLQILTLIESAIKRQYLSSNFETTKELLSPSLSGSAVRYSSDSGSVPVLPWIPQTIAAVALRLLELDSSIMYTQQERDEPCEEEGIRDYMKLPSRYSPFKNIEVELKERYQDEPMKNENGPNVASRHSSYGCGRGGRDLGLGRRWQRKVSAPKSDAGRKNARAKKNQLKQQGKRTSGQRQQGGRTDGQGFGRGRRTVRRRRAERTVEEKSQGHATQSVSPRSYGESLSGPVGSVSPYRESPRNSGDEEWADEEVKMMCVGNANHSNSAEFSESDDDNDVQAGRYARGSWEVGFDGGSNRWNGDLMEVSDEDVNASEDENGVKMMEDGEQEGDVDVEQEGDVDVSDGSDGGRNILENNEGTDSEVSDDFSD